MPTRLAQRFVPGRRDSSAIVPAMAERGARSRLRVPVGASQRAIGGPAQKGGLETAPTSESGSSYSPREVQRACSVFACTFLCRLPLEHVAMSQIQDWSRLALRAGALALASQRVIGARVTRAAVATPVALSPRDQAEFTGMVVEKYAAATEAMQAAGLVAFRVQSQLAAAWMQALTRPWFVAGASGQAVAMSPHGMRSAQSLATAWMAAWPRMLAAGMAPVARRAHANDRRLARLPRGAARGRR